MQKSPFDPDSSKQETGAEAVPTQNASEPASDGSVSVAPDPVARDEAAEGLQQPAEGDAAAPSEPEVTEAADAAAPAPVETAGATGEVEADTAEPQVAEDQPSELSVDAETAPVVIVPPQVLDRTGPIRRAGELERAYRASLVVESAVPAAVAMPEPIPAPATPASNFAKAKAFSGLSQGPTKRDREYQAAMIMLSKLYIIREDYQPALTLLHQAEVQSEPHIDVQRLLGETYFTLGEYELSLKHWNRTSTLTKRTDVAMQRRIGLKIMRCNANLSIKALAAGDELRAAEHLFQAIEAVDFTVYLKMREDMVQALSGYLKNHLRKIQPDPEPRPENPKRIAIVVDIVKMSAVHTHKHLYLSLACAIAALDPEITIDIIATFERQVAWNAGFEDYYQPSNKRVLEAFLHEMVPEEIASRVKITYFETFGIHGLMNTTRALLEMKHDLILYGSGQQGYHGNESLVVRHTLFPYTPTAFFFVQSNNAVDSVNDIIIARGRHPIEGDPGTALVAYESYPPFPGLQAAWVPDDYKGVGSGGLKIVTAWVGVRLDKTLGAYTKADIDMILTLLDEVPDAEWHLVGAEDPATLLKGHKKFAAYRKARRIVVHPVLEYTKFYNLAATAALFFQPPGFTGGGGGASIARNNGVPILCFRHSDVAPLQPQDFVFEEENLADGVQAALRILQSTEARNHLVSLQNALMESRRADSPQRFYARLKEAVAIYNARIAPPPLDATDPE